MKTLLILFALLFPLLPLQDDEVETKTVDELRENISWRGREFSPTGDYVMDWSGSGFEFEVQGTSFLDASFVSPAGKIAVTVNDGLPNRIFLHNEESIHLVQNLDPSKKSTVKVYKDNEAGGGLCALHSLSFDEGATFAKTPEKKHRFDFLGASITCGNQIDHEKNISAYGAFPRILSDLFDADYHAVCISGRGLMEGYNSESNWAGSNQNQLKDVYFTSSFYRDPSKQYNLADYEPELLVANVGCNDLGTNIMSLYGTTIDSYLEQVGLFHHKVRQSYPKAYILYMYGTYQNRWYSNEYRSYIERLNQEDGKSGFLYMPFYSDGADNHPSYLEHEEIAMRLANYLMDHTDLKPVREVLHPETRYEAEDAERYGFGAGNPVNLDKNINLSEWHGVRDLGAHETIEDPRDIDDLGTTLKVFYQEVEDVVPGDYEFYLGYQNPGEEMTCYVSLDGGEFQPLRLPKTGSNITYLSPALPLKMGAGSHDLIITGPNSLSSNIVYDYFSLRPLIPRYAPPAPEKEEEEKPEEKPFPYLAIILPAAGGAIIIAALLIIFLRKKKH